MADMYGYQSAIQAQNQREQAVEEANDLKQANNLTATDDYNKEVSEQDAMNDVELAKDFVTGIMSGGTMKEAYDARNKRVEKAAKRLQAIREGRIPDDSGEPSALRKAVSGIADKAKDVGGQALEAGKEVGGFIGEKLGDPRDWDWSSVGGGGSIAMGGMGYSPMINSTNPRASLTLPTPPSARSSVVSFDGNAPSLQLSGGIDETGLGARVGTLPPIRAPTPPPPPSTTAPATARPPPPPGRPRPPGTILRPEDRPTPDGQPRIPPSHPPPSAPPRPPSPPALRQPEPEPEPLANPPTTTATNITSADDNPTHPTPRGSTSSLARSSVLSSVSDAPSDAPSEADSEEPSLTSKIISGVTGADKETAEFVGRVGGAVSSATMGGLSIYDDVSNLVASHGKHLFDKDASTTDNIDNITSTIASVSDVVGLIPGAEWVAGLGNLIGEGGNVVKLFGDYEKEKTNVPPKPPPEVLQAKTLNTGQIADVGVQSALKVGGINTY